MSRNYRFEPPTDFEELDTTMCENCNYDCWDAGRCLMEDPE